MQIVFQDPYGSLSPRLSIAEIVEEGLLAQGVKVDLPQAEAKPVDQESKEPLVVIVDSEGRLYLEGDKQPRQVAPDELVNYARIALDKQPGIQVLVRGDKNAAYGKVVTAMTLLQQAGAPSVGLLTQPPEGPRRR